VYRSATIRLDQRANLTTSAQVAKTAQRRMVADAYGEPELQTMQGRPGC
jgi:hypothetical protein